MGCSSSKEAVAAAATSTPTPSSSSAAASAPSNGAAATTNASASTTIKNEPEKAAVPKVALEATAPKFVATPAPAPSPTTTPVISYQVPLNDNIIFSKAGANGNASASAATTPSGSRPDSPDFEMIDIVDGCTGVDDSERSLGDFSAASHEMASKAFQAMASSVSMSRSGSESSTSNAIGNGIPKLDQATRQRTSTTDSEAVASTGKGMKHSTSKIFSDREDKMTDLKGRVVHIEVPFGKPIEEVYDGVQTGPVLGSGISGVVRLCVHQKTGVKYAVKCLDLGLIDTEAQLKQLKEEIYIMCQLDHPNIVRLEEVYESHNEIFLVQELCLGGELFDRLDEQPDYHYTEAQCARLVKQMLCAVRYIHSKGIVHRDLKLENFLFSNTSSESELKMIDFGLSKHFDRGEVHKEAVGTPYTVAPEVIKGSYDEKCDVWAIGVITYLLLSGDPPFGGCGGPEPLTTVRQNILSGKFKFEPLDIWASVSPQAKQFISTCLVTNPRHRPTAAESQKHSWIKEWVKRHKKERDGRDGGGGKLNPNVVNALVNFKNYSDMRKLLCEVLSFTLLPDQIQGLRGEFEKMDTDGSGEISLGSLKQVLLSNAGAGSLGALTEEEVEDIFHAMRVRKDEPTIQWHEFIAAGLSQCKVDDRNLKLAFDRLDSDHKNYISLADMMDLMGNSYSETALKEMFQDTLNLGKTEEARITYDDFLRLMKGQAPKRRVVQAQPQPTPTPTPSSAMSFLGAGQQNHLSNVAATAAASASNLGQALGQLVSNQEPASVASTLASGPTPCASTPSSNGIPMMPSLISSQQVSASGVQCPVQGAAPVDQDRLTAEILHHQNPDVDTANNMVLEPGSLPGGIVNVNMNVLGAGMGVGTGVGVVHAIDPLAQLSNGATGSLRGLVAGVGGGMTPLAVVQENSTMSSILGDDDATTMTNASASPTKLSMVGSGDYSDADLSTTADGDVNADDNVGLDMDADMDIGLDISHVISDSNTDAKGEAEMEDTEEKQDVFVSKEGAENVMDIVTGEAATTTAMRLPSQPSLTASYSDMSGARPSWGPSNSVPALQVGNLNQSMMLDIDDSVRTQKEPDAGDEDAPADATANGNSNLAPSMMMTNTGNRNMLHQNSGSGALTFDEDDEALGGLENLDVNGGDLTENNEIVITSNVGAAIKRLSGAGGMLDYEYGTSSNMSMVMINALSMSSAGTEPGAQSQAQPQLTASEHLQAMFNSTGHVSATDSYTKEQVVTQGEPQTPPQPARQHIFKNGTIHPSASPPSSGSGSNPLMSPQRKLSISPLSTSLYSRRRSKSVDEGDGMAAAAAAAMANRGASSYNQTSSSLPLASQSSMESATSGSSTQAPTLARHLTSPSVGSAKSMSMDERAREQDATFFANGNTAYDDGGAGVPFGGMDSDLSAPLSLSVTGRLIKDANAPPLQVNRELYRAHRRMRLGVLEASKQFEEERMKRARRQATQESMRNSANSQHRSRAGLVMKHGNTRLISTEEIRQMLDNEEKTLEEKVEAVTKRTGRGPRGTTGPRHHRKKTVSDMSGMLG